MRNNKGTLSKMVVWVSLSLLLGSFLSLDFLRSKEGKESLIPWFSFVNYEKISQDIYFTTSGVLTEMGIPDKNLVLSYQEEKKAGMRKWIHSTAQIKVSNARSLEEYRDNIKKAVEKVGGKIINSRIYKDGKVRSLALTIGAKQSIITYSLVLEQPL